MGSCLSSCFEEQLEVIELFPIEEDPPVSEPEPEAPLAQEENLEDSDPLPSHYQVVQSDSYYLRVVNHYTRVELIHDYERNQDIVRNYYYLFPTADPRCWGLNPHQWRQVPQETAV